MTLIQKCGPGIRESFFDLCINLLNEEQLPLDTRSTSGMLCVICAKVSQGQDGWLNVFTELLQLYIALFNWNQLLTKICLAFIRLYHCWR